MMNKKGFTLMEMMVVVLIIVLLSSFAYPLYTKGIMKARIADAFSLAEIVREAQQRNFVLNKQYFSIFTNQHTMGRTRLVKSGGVTAENGKLKKGKYLVYITNKAATANEAAIENGCINVAYTQDGGSNLDRALFIITTHVEDSKIWCVDFVDEGICNSIPSVEPEDTRDCAALN